MLQGKPFDALTHAFSFSLCALGVLGVESQSALSTSRHLRDTTLAHARRRYWEEDVIEPEVEVSPQGSIRVPAGAGIGYRPRLDRIEKLTARKEVLS